MRFNGVDLSSVHEGLSIEKEVPPGSTHALETTQNMGGNVITNERLEAGEYLARVNIAGWSEREGLDIREMLTGWAYLPGLKTGELIPTNNPKRCYEAKLKSISPPEFNIGFATVEVRFAVPRPVALDISESRASGAGSIRAMIRGTYACRPVIVQTIAQDRDGLALEMDGAPILTMTGALKAGQRVEMDTRRGSLTVDGEHAESRIDVLGTRWQPGYWPGGHEIASSDGGAMEMRWHNEWL